MFKKWYIFYVLAIVLLPIFLLFAVRLKSPSEIIVPPGFYGETAEVQAAFEASLSVSDRDRVTLKYPTAGDYRTAFVMKNLDFDPEEEVIVFYSLNSDESTVRMNVLDNIDGEWESVYDEPGYGSEIISVDFDDLNKDGEIEIICSWSLYESNLSKVMTVHSTRIQKEKPIQLKIMVTQSYSFFDVVDLDSDGFDEILLLWADSSSVQGSTNALPKTFATLLKMHGDDTISPVGQPVILDSSVSSYGTMKVQKSVEDGNPIAFVDAYKGESTMITEVLWWDAENQTLVAPMFDSVKLSNTATIRSPAVESMDIDGDGFIEIPVNHKDSSIEQTPLYPTGDSSDTSKGGQRINLTTWMSITTDGLEPKYYSFINDVAGFSFRVPQNLTTNLVAFTTDAGVMTIYTSYDGVNQGEPLFSLVLKERDEMTGKDTYTFRKTKGDYIVFGTLTGAGEKFGFTNELISESIVIFDEGV